MNFFSVQQALVATAAKLQGQIAFSEDEGAIDQEVNLAEQVADGCVFPGHRHQLFQRIARVGNDVKPGRMNGAGDVRERGGLAKGLAAGKGDARQQRIGQDLSDHGLGCGVMATGKIVGLGIVAAVAVVRAALGEDHKADSRPIDDGLSNTRMNAQGQRCV